MLVSLNRQVVDGLRAEFSVGRRGPGQRWRFTAGNCLAGHANNRTGGSILLGASAVAATTGMAFRFDGDMPELARHAIHTVPDFSSKHDPAADSGAERDHRHVRDAAGGAQPLLAERGNVSVVFEDNADFFVRTAQTALDFRAHRIVLPTRQVRRLPQHSGLHVDDAGDADTSAKKLSGLLVLAG